MKIFEYSNHVEGLSALVINRNYRLFGHLLFVSVYLAYTTYCATYYRPFIPDARVNYAVWGWFFVLNTGLAYLNVYYLMPRFLYRHLRVAYTISMIGCIVLIAASLALTVHILDILYRSGQFLSSLQSLRIIIPLSFACPMVVVLYRRRYTNEKRINQLEYVTMQSELEQLKKQINPHFLFNMLNNAIVLIKTDSREASKVLVKLKDLLNYQLADSASDDVLLTDDIQFLVDYLNLEKVRRDRFEFEVTIDGNTDGIHLPPLLFIHFVENAIKHNHESDEFQPYVRIRFQLTDRNLHFTCINSKPNTAQPTTTNGGGLGLINTKRRLSLLYPGKHTLHIENQTERFQVDLLFKHTD
jgi:sensor histidine kinase YesM